MDVVSHAAALRREAALLAAAAAGTPLDAAVPMCPDWQVRDVLRHLGGVHRWARAQVAGRRTDPIEGEEQAAIMRPPDDDAALAGWVHRGAELLASTLEAAPPGIACWAFLPAPSPLAFWARRQAHETAIHRRDVEAAAGPVTPFPPELAADGIDELLCGFASRKNGRLRSDTPALLVVEASDAGAAWAVDIGPEGASARPGPAPDAGGRVRCTVRGGASPLYLFLWNRSGPETVEVDGDPALLDVWCHGVRVRWT